MNKKVGLPESVREERLVLSVFVLALLLATCSAVSLLTMLIPKAG